MEKDRGEVLVSVWVFLSQSLSHNSLFEKDNKKGRVKRVKWCYLHLSSPVLKPELDLARIQSQFPAQLHPLFLVWMRTFLKHPIKTHQKNLFDLNYQSNKKTKMENLKWKNDKRYTLRVVESGGECGGGSVSSSSVYQSHHHYQVLLQNPSFVFCLLQLPTKSNSLYY